MMFEFSTLTSLAIAGSYTIGIRKIEQIPLKILYSLVFTLILLWYFPILEGGSFYNIVKSSCATLLVMSGPLSVLVFKYLKFRDFDHHCKPEDVYFSLHCLLTGPICEEIIFRHVIGKITRNNITQALIFAMVHFNLNNLSSSLVQVGFTFIFSIWAGLLKCKFGIEGCISSHLLCNWIGFPDFEFFLVLEKKLMIFVILLQITCSIWAIKLFS
jgi:hypothetical protein